MKLGKYCGSPFKVLFMGLILQQGQAWAECSTNVDELPQPNRYSVNGDNTITDQTTQLQWQRCAAGFGWSATGNLCSPLAGQVTDFTWQEALVYAKNFAGASGWRLPNTKELESLVKRSCVNPAIETSVFSITPIGTFWTSTAAIGYFGNAWVVSFSDGSLLTGDKTNPYQVRLVKSL